MLLLLLLLLLLYSTLVLTIKPTVTRYVSLNIQHKYCIPFLLYSNVDTVLQMQRQQHYCLSSTHQLWHTKIPADMTDLFIPDELICTCKSVLYLFFFPFVFLSSLPTMQCTQRLPLVRVFHFLLASGGERKKDIKFWMYEGHFISTRKK